MPIRLNYLNIYTVDGTFCKSICIGDALRSIGEVERLREWERKYTFSDLRLYPNFWAVTYIDEDLKTYQTGRKKKPVILFFDWQGEPLLKLEMENHITSFDIDLLNGHLYTLDAITDVFCMYEIHDILEKINL